MDRVTNIARNLPSTVRPTDQHTVAGNPRRGSFDLDRDGGERGDDDQIDLLTGDVNVGDRDTRDPELPYPLPQPIEDPRFGTGLGLIGDDEHQDHPSLLQVIPI
jgi:hypothetical protein